MPIPRQLYPTQGSLVCFSLPEPPVNSNKKAETFYQHLLNILEKLMENGILPMNVFKFLTDMNIPYKFILNLLKKRDKYKKLFIIKVFKLFNPHIDLGFRFLDFQLFENGWNGSKLFYTEEEYKQYREKIVNDETFQLLMEILTSTSESVIENVVHYSYWTGDLIEHIVYTLFDKPFYFLNSDELLESVVRYLLLSIIIFLVSEKYSDF